jgi:hypothetical protein
LSYRQAAFALDRPQARAAILAAAREHDARTLWTVMIGERSEKNVDGPRAAARTQTKLARINGQIVAGRDDVGLVALDGNAIGRGLHRQRCVWLQ